MWGPIAAGVAAPVIGGIIGNKLASGDRASQEEYMLAALNEIKNIQVPEERELALEELKSAGVLTPEMEQVYRQQDTELSNISLDPATRQAQMEALGGLQDVANQGGMTLTDRARLNQVLGDMGTAERGMREAALQGLRRRGMGGSGMELEASMMAGQQAAQQAAQQSLGVEAMAQQRALDALMQAGQLGGDIRGQDWNQASQAAQAQDAINRFNIANRQDVGARNIASRNAAQAANLQNKQDIMNQNVGLRNQAQQYNLGADQRRFDNEMKRATAMAGQQQGVADMYGDKANQTQQMWGNLGQAAGKGFATYAANKK